jgi:hypothetical protein
MAEPIDLAAGQKATQLRTRLAQQMDKLMQTLHREFVP